MQFYPNTMKRFYWLTLFACLFIPGLAWGQTSMQKTSQLERFEQAEKYLSAFNVDSAIFILTKLVEELEQANELKTPFGLKVQLREASGYEYDQQDSLAFVKLHHINKLSKAEQSWAVYANSCLILARLYERIGVDSTCLVYLRSTDALIKQHAEIDSLYPLFCIRSASYHRIFADPDSAKYYAQEALRTAKIHKQIEEKAVAHMLLGMLLHNHNTPERLSHWKEAARLFYKVKDYTGYGYMTGSAGGWYYENGLYEKALAYNDTSIMLADRAKLNGYDQHYLLTSQYKFRSKLYSKLGQPDSALYYLKKGYDNELSHVYKSNSEKIYELNAIYNVEKKEQKIKEQAQLLEYEKERKYWWTGLAAMVFLFAGIIGYYAWRLRKTNENLAGSLQQQQMMQGELHHRVKNNLQVIISLLDLQKDEIDDDDARKSMQGMSNRIYSMAAIHEILYQKEGIDLVNFLEYTQNLCNYFSNFLGDNDKPVFEFDIADKSFNLETLMPLGIVLNELLTNSLKYAVQDNKRLRISISMKSKGEGLLIRYIDNGPGFPLGQIEEREGGLGTYLVRSMARQLQGHLFTQNENGALTEFFFREKNS